MPNIEAAKHDNIIARVAANEACKSTTKRSGRPSLVFGTLCVGMVWQYVTVGALFIPCTANSDTFSEGEERRISCRSQYIWPECVALMKDAMAGKIPGSRVPSQW
jgi:hypothetical protein